MNNDHLILLSNVTLGMKTETCKRFLHQKLSSEARLIGIKGLRGAGKTTLVKHDHHNALIAANRLEYGRCNASCFYCPTSQDETAEPLSNGIPFATPDDYAEYVSLFGFTGASISGGEPLLTLDRTLAYLTAVRRRCGDSVHLWMYTNGTLLTQEIAGRQQLSPAGFRDVPALGAPGDC